MAPTYGFPTARRSTFPRRAGSVSPPDRSAVPHIALQDGTLRAHVAHRPGAEWVLQAGPFSVTVHGTVFDLSWRQASEVLVVALHEGQVSVMGGPALEPIALTPGQRLEASSAHRRAANRIARSHCRHVFRHAAPVSVRRTERRPRADELANWTRANVGALHIRSTTRMRNTRAASEQSELVATSGRRRVQQRADRGEYSRP